MGGREGGWEICSHTFQWILLYTWRSGLLPSNIGVSFHLMDWAGEGKMPGKLRGSTLMLPPNLTLAVACQPPPHGMSQLLLSLWWYLLKPCGGSCSQGSVCQVLPTSGLFTCVNGAAFRCPYKPVINYFHWAKVKCLGRIESDSPEDLYSPSPTRRPSTSNIWSNLHSSDAWEMEDLLARQRLRVGVRLWLTTLNYQ